MPKVLKVIDKSDSQVIHNGLLPDVRFFMVACGRTGSSKSTLITNIVANPEFPYSKIFKGENIYIFSGSLNSDEKIKKIIEFKEIPEENVYPNLNDEELNDLYDKLEEEYTERNSNEEPVEYPLVILDDLSFTGGFHGKKFNALNRFAMNSRKLAISVIVTTQYYYQILPSIRANASVFVLYNTSQKNLEAITDEHNYFSKKSTFIKMFKSNVKDKRDFMVVNYDNAGTDIYLNKEFEPIFPKESEMN